MAIWAIEIPTIYQTRVEAMREESLSLIERAQGGDLAAFREIIERYSPRIHSIAYQMVGNSEDAQDIAQEVCLRLYSSLDKFDPKHSFTTWLYRVTVNLSIDYQRRSARHRHVSLDEMEDETGFEDRRPRPDSRAERNELRGVVSQLVQDLPLKQRKVFVLRDLQGFSSEEVAEILKCSPVTVRVHLARARGRIKEALSSSGILKPSQEVNADEMPNR
jgi:RNA polymerase sigma-70 factor (ECF subfamily)